MTTTKRPVRGHSPLTVRRTRIATIALGMLVFAVVAASCDSGSSSSSDKSSTPSSTAAADQVAVKPVGGEVAVAKYLKGQGVEYAGDCADAKLPRDKGKWCSTLLEGADSNEKKVYGIGPVGEKPTKVITITRHGSAQLTPGFQVGVSEGNVGNPSQLTREQLEANVFITGNLVLDQAAGIGNGLGDLPAGAPTPGGQTGGGGTGGGGTGTPPPPTVIVNPPNTGGEQYPPKGVIVVVNPNVQVGGEVTFNGSGCAANEPLQVSFDGTPIGTISADAQGNFAGSISIPLGTTPGAHTLTVQGAVCVLNASITVVGGLAFTGSSSHTVTYVLGALAAIMLGFVLVVGTRRRRSGIRGRQMPPPSSA